MPYMTDSVNIDTSTAVSPPNGFMLLKAFEHSSSKPADVGVGRDYAGGDGGSKS